MLPLVRQQPWYPGQPGVSGSDVQRGLRTESAAIVLYVDENYPGAVAVGDGTDPERPLNSVQTAINTLIALAAATGDSLEGSVIVVANEATIAESVIIPINAPMHCSIVGAGATAHQPLWTAATAAGTALTVRREGWTIEGITFEVGTAGTAIRLEEVPLSGIMAYKTTIRNCRFDGLWGGLYGIDLYGAPHRTIIENCEFLEFQRGDRTAFAVCVTSSGHANPYECHMRNNVFWENENHVGSLNGAHGWNMSTFVGNIFHQGVLIASAIQLDLRGGTVGGNLVTGNSFFGDYSNVGGYYDTVAGAGFWNGNFTNDVAEAEVDATTGITFAPPT